MRLLGNVLAVASWLSAPQSGAVVQPPSDLRTFVIPRAAADLRPRPDDEHPAPKAPIRSPRGFDLMRTTLGLGYVQGADWGAELRAGGAFAGVQVQLNSLTTRGRRGLVLEHGTLSLFDPEVGWGLETGDIFSQLFGMNRGARLTVGKSGWRPSFSVYGPRPFSSLQRTLFAWRDQIAFGKRTLFEGELASDGSHFLQSRLMTGRVDLAASYRRLAAPLDLRDKSVQLSVNLWRGSALRGSLSRQEGWQGPTEWWTAAFRLPTWFLNMTIERAYFRTGGATNTADAVMADLSTGRLRLFHRYQWGQTNFLHSSLAPPLEREQLQSMASYSTGSRLHMILQLATQWNETGRPQHWEELQTTVRITRGTTMTVVTAVPDLRNLERLRLRFVQSLPAQFALEADYGRLSAYQGIVHELDRSRYKVMLLKTFNVPTPARGGEIAGRVVDNFGRPVAGVRVRLGSYTADTTASGAYAFAHVPNGEFDLAIDENVLPADYAWDGRRLRLTVRASTHERHDLLVAPLNAIHGRVYCDRNTNGRFDAGEGVAGAVVHLGDSVTATGDNGAYDFYNVRPGTHVVRLDKERLPAGFDVSAATELTVELRDDRPVTGADFRVTQKTKPIIWGTIK
jgi:SdrD B-like protein